MFKLIEIARMIKISLVLNILFIVSIFLVKKGKPQKKGTQQLILIGLVFFLDRTMEVRKVLTISLALTIFSIFKYFK